MVTKAPTGPDEEYATKEYSDVAFFRLGYFNFAKLNTESMIEMYEGGKWYSVDLLMNWDDQRVSIYINDKAYKSENFFTQRSTKLESANAISLYGLSPGSLSEFRNLRVCNEVCDVEEVKEMVDLSGAILGYNSAFSLVVGLSALTLALFS